MGAGVHRATSATERAERDMTTRVCVFFIRRRVMGCGGEHVYFRKPPQPWASNPAHGWYELTESARDVSLSLSLCGRATPSRMTARRTPMRAVRFATPLQRLAGIVHRARGARQVSGRTSAGPAAGRMTSAPRFQLPAPAPHAPASTGPSKLTIARQHCRSTRGHRGPRPRVCRKSRDSPQEMTPAANPGAKAVKHAAPPRSATGAAGHRQERRPRHPMAMKPARQQQSRRTPPREQQVGRDEVAGDHQRARQPRQPRALGNGHRQRLQPRRWAGKPLHREVGGGEQPENAA